MKAVTASSVPVGDGWMYEPKWDGHRVLARRVGDEVDAVSSTGKPKLPQWPWLARAIIAATDHDVVVDERIEVLERVRRAGLVRVRRQEDVHGLHDVMALPAVDVMRYLQLAVSVAALS